VATVAELERQVESFRIDNPWIFDLINYFEGAAPIPWGQVGVRSNYQSYMYGPYDQALRAFTALDFRPEAISSHAATDAAKQMFDSTKGFWDKTKSAGTIAWETFSGGGMNVVADVLVIFVGTAFKHLEYGYNLHVSGAATAFLRTVEARMAKEVQGKRITQDRAVLLISNAEKALQYHASAVRDGLLAIGNLDRNGYLDRAKQSRSGVGALPAGVIAILGVAAIAAAAMVIVAMYQISTVNKIIAEQCSTFTDQKARLACTESALSKLPTWDMAAIAGGITKALVFGGLVVLGVMFAPFLVRQVFGVARTIQKERSA
jgi:hypothetical protein